MHDSNYLQARSSGYRALHDGIGVLYETWNIVSSTVEESHPAYESLQHIFARTSSRCRKVLERLYRAHAFEVIESVIDYWHIDQVCLTTAFKSDGD